MNTFLASKRFFRPIFLHRLINPKPFSSQSVPPNPPDNPTAGIISKLQQSPHHRASATDHPPSISTSGSEIVDDDRVIQVLLGYRNDPISALEYCNWTNPSPQFFRGDIFWVLIHILVTSLDHQYPPRSLLNLFVSNNPTLTPNLIVNDLIDSAKRYGFEVNSIAYNHLLDAFISNRRTNDAVDCFKLMMKDPNVEPYVPDVNKVITDLIRVNSIEVAKEVYNTMLKAGHGGGDNVTTQLLMRACLRERNPEEAVKIFKRVRSRGAEPDSLLYSLAVQAACKTSDMALAMELLREMKYEASQENYTSVIVAFVKEGNVEEAVKVKDEMVRRGKPVSVIGATSLVDGYCKRGELGKALVLFDKMVVEEGLVPDKVMLKVMTEWFCKNEKMGKAVKVYRRMKALGITPSSVLVRTMIQGCLKAESPEAALEIFESELVANSFMGNTILSMLCRQGKTDAAMKLLRMIETNVVSYNNVILAYCRKKEMDLARLVFSELLGKGIEPNSFTYSILIDGCFNDHDEEKAWDVFNQMSSKPEASEVVYNTFISGLCRVGKTYKAREMLRRCPVSCLSYNSVIDGFFREGEIDFAVETYREMSKNGIAPSVVTFTSLINGFCKIDRMDLAIEMRYEMKRKDLELDIPAYGALIDGFCKRRDMKTAYALFSELLKVGLVPNVSVYNSLISGFRNLENMEAAMELHKKMTNDGVSCDLFTYTTLIDGLLKDGNLIVASGLYSEVLASGIVPDKILYTVLVNGLSKKGQFLKARKMLSQKKDMTPSTLIYSAVIAGHYREGNLDEAFRLRDEMLEKGLVHDDTIFDILVSGSVKETTRRSYC